MNELIRNRPAKVNGDMVGHAPCEAKALSESLGAAPPTQQVTEKVTAGRAWAEKEQQPAWTSLEASTQCFFSCFFLFFFFLFLGGVRPQAA